MVEFEDIWDLFESPLEFLNLFKRRKNGQCFDCANRDGKYLFEVAAEFDRWHVGEHSILAHDQPSVLEYKKVAFDTKQV